LRARHVAATGCLLTALTFGATACGGAKKDGRTSGSDSTGGTSLTIYSSLPNEGASRAQSQSITNGERLAVQAIGGRIGPFTVKRDFLDDATPKAGKWDPGAASSNARTAAQDKSTIAYIGELNSDASAISIPILNEATILQVSPTASSIGLTSSVGADKGEPEKYYPSGKRTFARVTPTDKVQAAAQVTYQRAAGCLSTFVLSDHEIYGSSLARNVITAAKAQALPIAGSEFIDERADGYQALAESVAAKGADCVFFGGITDSGAVRLFEDLHTAMPAAKLFGAAALAESGFVTQLTPSTQRRVWLTSPTLPPRFYPPAGRAFFTTYRQTFGSRPELSAIFGYEAMSAVLQAIKDAGPDGNNRQAVIDAFFRIKDRRSVLGAYSITPAGDTTLATGFAGYRIKRGRLSFDHRIAQQGT
jgi:branched-chain amino acid transport system substrate-binding protein